MNKSIIIRDAVKDGDGECGLLRIGSETYIEVFGEDKYKEELKYRKERLEEFKVDLEEAKQNNKSTEYYQILVEDAEYRLNQWVLYLEDLIRALDIDKDDIFDIEIKLLQKKKNNVKK